MYKRQEQGYRLKIYDSYRPNRATRDIYDKAEALANEPVPEPVSYTHLLL